ncbi:hypothetical protein IJ579_01515 [bacterium]|nr:hypothetical protein [bacterium]
MSSIISHFNESFADNLSVVKMIIYTIPVFICASFFVKGEMNSFYFWLIPLLLFFLGVLTKGINNIRTNNNELLTFNIWEIIYSMALSIVCVVPQIIIFGAIGLLIVNFIKLPVELPHFQLIFEIIIWSILGSIVLTSYLAFAKHMYILQAFNYKLIIDSCMDVLVSLMFFVPQLMLANAIMVAPALAICSQFGIPYTHWAFIAYYSFLVVVNISLLANYFAETAFENIKEDGKSSYVNNYDKSVDVIDDIVSRLD